METLNKEKLMFSNRAIMTFIFPIILENIMSIAAGLIDTVMVSGCGEAAVSGISLSNSIIAIFCLIFPMFISGGITVMSQYIGRRDFQNAKKSAYHIFFCSVGISAVVAAVIIGFIPEMLNLVYGELDAELFENARKYFFFRALWLPFVSGASSTAAILRTQNKSGQASFLYIFSSIINVLGNAFLIYGLKLGVAGAAIATGFSFFAWMVLGIIFLKNKKLEICLDSFLKFRPDFDIIKRILRIGFPGAVEGVLMQSGGLLFSRIMAGFGTVAVAAYSTANSVANVGWTVLYSFTMALTYIVGQCMGAGETHQAKYYTKKLANFSYLIAIVMFGIIFILRTPLAGMFDFGEDTKKLCADMIAAAAMATVFSVHPWAYEPLSSFRASGDVRYPVVIGVTAMFVFQVGLTYLLGVKLGFGPMSVWIGLWAAMAFRTVCNVIRFKSGVWLTKKVI